MTFTTRAVKTKTLGEYLSECRKHSHLPLHEIAVLCQVQPKYITALEEGRFRDLPAAVYVRGFLRSLAKAYRVPGEDLLRQYEEEINIARNAQLLRQPIPRTMFSSPRFILSPRTLTLLAVAVSGLLSLMYLYFQISSLTRPPKLELYFPAADGAANSSLLLLRGKTEPGASVFLNNQPLVVEVGGEFSETLSLAEGANQLVLKAVNKFGQETVLTRSLLLQEKEIAGSFTPSEQALTGFTSVVPSGDSSLPPRLTLEVAIGAEAVWIYLESDGEQKYSGIMLPNSRRIVTAQDRVVLSTANAGMTRVFLNGKDLGILGKPGEAIRDIEFTK